MFKFSAALFLLGTVTILIPVILHFMRRRPSTKILFPSFYFLNTINNVARKNINNIKRWLILILRCLAITFLCAAFALPFIPEIPQNISSAQVILVDSSMSMKTNHSIPGVDTAARLLANMKTNTIAVAGCIGDTTVWSGEFTGKRDELERFIKENYSSDTSSHYECALRQADAILRKIKVAHKSIILITDMQKLPWKNIKTDIPLSPSVDFKVISSGKKNPAIKNLWIENVQTEIINGELKAAATLVNGSQDSVSFSLKVSVDGKSQTAPIKLAPLEKNIFYASIKDINNSSKHMFGTAEIDVQDDLQADNYFYFSLAGQRTPEVLITKPENGRTDFIMTALRPDVSSSCASIKYIEAENLPAQLQDADIIFLRNAVSFENNQIDALKKSVESGVGLIISWDNSSSMGKLLKEFGISVSRNDNRQGKTESLNNINFENLPFKKFTESQVGNLYDITFFNVPKFKLPENANVLADFSNGAPAIAELPYGKGTVYLFSFSLDRSGTDWPVRATFLPFWHELMKQFNVKHNADDMTIASFKSINVSGLKNVKKIDPAGGYLHMRDKLFIPAFSGVYLLETDTEKKVLCVNHSNEESEISYMPESFKPVEIMANKNKTDESNGPENATDSENGKNLFAACFLLALICGCGELLLSNRTAL